ncbi:MAG: DNA polymerase III subunit beta [Planctomycetota bacterium]
MKILCDRQRLLDAFSAIGSIPPQKTTKPVVQHVLARTTDAGLELVATDFELSAKIRIDQVDVREPGELLLPAKETSALLREISETSLSLTREEQRCRIDAGSGSFVLLGDDPREFPKEPQVEADMSFELPASALQEMVRRTSFAAAKEQTRYAINGLLMHVQDGSVRLVATDGRRLALTYAAVDDPDTEGRVVVPLRTLQLISKALDQDSTVTVSVSKTQIAFRNGPLYMVSQLLEDRFPQYEQVIPKAASTTLEIDRVDLERNLRRVAVLCSGDVPMVRFAYDGDTLSLTTESANVGRADQSMQISVKGDGGAISFNPEFLLDALKVSDLEQVRFDLSDESTPGKVTLGEAYTYILMPVSGS